MAKHKGRKNKGRGKVPKKQKGICTIKHINKGDSKAYSRWICGVEGAKKPHRK